MQMFWGLDLLVLVLFVLILVLKAGVDLWWRPRKIERHFLKQGIKGPSYHFFIGNMKELVGLMLKASSQPMPLCHNILPRVLPFYHHWKKLYGANFVIWFGATPRLAVSDPALIREIFTSSEFYEKYEAHPSVKQLEGDSLLNLKGEKWAYHRKIISPTFHMENLNMMIPVMAKSVGEMLEKWKAMSDKEVEIDVSEWFQTLTEEVVTRTAFGSSYEDGKAIFKLQAQQMVFATDSFNKVFIPGYRFLPTKQNRSSWKLDKEIRKSLTMLIDLRRRKSPADLSESCPKDLLGLMIRANLRQQQQQHQQQQQQQRRSDSSDSSMITVDDIIEECKGFFFAGKHTTSNLLTWTTILLSMHPHWQHSARDEVLRVCGSRDTPSKDDVAKLKTLGMILNESLRLYPPIVAAIRRARRDVRLGTSMIQRGTELLVPILAVHHDQSLWGHDAAEFNPTRFARGAGQAAKHPTSFVPFGLGARRCIGQNLVIVQAKLAMAMILRQFSFGLAPSYQHAPTVLMLLHPQYGAPITFRKISKPMIGQDQQS